MATKDVGALSDREPVVVQDRKRSLLARLANGRPRDVAFATALAALAACGQRPDAAGRQTFAVLGPLQPAPATEPLPPSIQNVTGLNATGQARIKPVQTADQNSIPGRFDITFAAPDPRGRTGIFTAQLVVGDGQPQNGIDTQNIDVIGSVDPVPGYSEFDVSTDQLIATPGFGGGEKGGRIIARKDYNLRENDVMKWDELGQNCNVTPDSIFPTLSPDVLKIIADFGGLNGKEQGFGLYDLNISKGGDWCAEAIANGTADSLSDPKLNENGYFEVLGMRGITQKVNLKPRTILYGKDGQGKDVELGFDGKNWGPSPGAPTVIEAYIKSAHRGLNVQGKMEVQIFFGNTGSASGQLSTLSMIDNGDGSFAHNNTTFGAKADADDDGDGVPNAIDNCPTLPNPDQVDKNNNKIGDECDVKGCNDVNGAKNPSGLRICDSDLGYKFAFRTPLGSTYHSNVDVVVKNGRIQGQPGQRLRYIHSSMKEPSMPVDAPGGNTIKKLDVYSTKKPDGTPGGGTFMWRSYMTMAMDSNSKLEKFVIPGPMNVLADPKVADVAVHEVGEALFGLEGSDWEVEFGTENKPMPPVMPVVDMGGVGDGPQNGDGGKDGGADGGEVTPDMIIEVRDMGTPPDFKDGGEVTPDMIMEVRDMGVPPDLKDADGNILVTNDMIVEVPDMGATDAATSPMDASTADTSDRPTSGEHDAGVAGADLGDAEHEQHAPGCGCKVPGSRKEEPDSAPFLLGGLALGAILEQRRRAFLKRANAKVMDTWGGR